jgi:CheY-like chemotaxis protein
MDPSQVVLLAEDNPDDALLMQQAFKSHGLMKPLHIVHDGSDAIAYLVGEGIYADRVAHPFPTLVILDLKMPRVSGFDVLQWLLDHPDFRVIPTIVWSSSADQRDVKHAYCIGANGYLVKPNDFQQFKAMVGRLLGFWENCEKPGAGPSVPTCASVQNTDPFAGAARRGG